LSTVTGTVIIEATANLTAKGLTFRPEEIAGCLAVISGAIVCFLGLIRLGWLVDFISLTAISAFMTGSAINIAAGQVPALMGIVIPSTRAPTYRVIINTLKGLPRTNLNAALGLTALTMLYLIRSLCNMGAKKWPQHKKAFFFTSTLRTVFVILLYTMISWLTNMHHKSKPSFTILGAVPRGMFINRRKANPTTDFDSRFQTRSSPHCEL